MSAELQFDSFIFKENKGIAAQQKRKELIKWLLVMVAVLFLVLEMYWITLLIAVGLGLVNYIEVFQLNNKIAPLNGSFPSSLSITKNEIRIGNVSYPVTDIQGLRIDSRDIRGNTTLASHFFVRYAQKSNGTNNALSFFYENQHFEFRFRVDSEAHAATLNALKKDFQKRTSSATSKP